MPDIPPEEKLYSLANRAMDYYSSRFPDYIATTVYHRITENNPIPAQPGAAGNPIPAQPGAAINPMSARDRVAAADREISRCLGEYKRDILPFLSRESDARLKYAIEEARGLLSAGWTNSFLSACAYAIEVCVLKKEYGISLNWGMEVSIIESHLRRDVIGRDVIVKLDYHGSEIYVNPTTKEVFAPLSGLKLMSSSMQSDPLLNNKQINFLYSYTGDSGLFKTRRIKFTPPTY